VPSKHIEVRRLTSARYLARKRREDPQFEQRRREARRKYAASKKGKLSQLRRELRAAERRSKQKVDPTSAYAEYLGFRIAHAAALDKPPLLWLDAKGKLHKEEELSAEELIRRHQKNERRKTT
jgi:hypothetical protein